MMISVGRVVFSSLIMTAKVKLLISCNFCGVQTEGLELQVTGLLIRMQIGKVNRQVCIWQTFGSNVSGGHQYWSLACTLQ
jgi:hypothetical protein